MQDLVGIVRREAEMTRALEGIERLWDRARRVGVTGLRDFNPGWHTALDLGSFGIRVNAVVPAEVMTPQYQKWLNNFKDPQGQLLSIAGKVPLGHRFTDVNEIAATTAFLLSANSGSITGQQVFVDGGYAHLDRGLT